MLSDLIKLTFVKDTYGLRTRTNNLLVISSGPEWEQYDKNINLYTLPPESISAFTYILSLSSYLSHIIDQILCILDLYWSQNSILVNPRCLLQLQTQDIYKQRQALLSPWKHNVGPKCTGSHQQSLGICKNFFMVQASQDND